MTQEQAVVEALRANGGYLTLGRLYQETMRVPGCAWGTKTPFASIQRIVQQSPRTFRIRPGLWGLEAEKERILQALGIAESAPAKRVEEFNHSYYQGLLLEIGNFEGFETYVPRQDYNRTYLSRPLGEVAGLQRIHPFTYEMVVRRAQTVDVSWYNARGFPHAFFEVEHSTDIHNSLLKFVELQDFRCRFWIVGPAPRKREYDSKAANPAMPASIPRSDSSITITSPAGTAAPRNPINPSSDFMCVPRSTTHENAGLPGYLQNDVKNGFTESGGGVRSSRRNP